MFEIGDRVAYPLHGAGIVELIEEKEILGQLQRYYVLRFALGGVKVMVPVEGKDIGLRAIIGKEEWMKVLEFLSQPCGEECDNWNRRYRENLEKMRTGSSRAAGAAAGYFGPLHNPWQNRQNKDRGGRVHRLRRPAGPGRAADLPKRRRRRNQGARRGSLGARPGRISIV